MSVAFLALMLSGARPAGGCKRGRAKYDGAVSSTVTANYGPPAVESRCLRAGPRCVARGSGAARNAQG
jgi:hypothetical protein